MDTITTVSDPSFLIQGIVIGVVAFILGGGLSFVLWNIALKKKNAAIINEAKTEAEVIKKDKILQAKEKFLHLKSEHE